MGYCFMNIGLYRAIACCCHPCQQQGVSYRQILCLGRCPGPFVGKLAVFGGERTDTEAHPYGVPLENPDKRITCAFGYFLSSTAL